MPDTENPQPPPIVALAERIAADIRARRLRPGDAYPGTAETAARFRVSGTTANRALQLLAHRGVLERRQRSGTFVADPAGRDAADGATGLRRVRLLVHEDYLRTEGLLADGVLIGLQGELPRAEIRFDFLPAAGEDAHVAALVAEALRSRTPEGFVLYRSSAASQRTVAASGLPAVISGTPHPGVTGLPWIDRDQRRIGQVLTGHLLSRGCRRIVALMRDRVTAGDHVLLDAVFAAVGAAGSIAARFLPADAEIVRAAIVELLAADRTPTGLVCRSEPLAAAAVEAVAGLPRRRRPEMAVADLYRRDGPAAGLAWADSAVEPQELGRELGRMLARQSGGRGPSEESSAGVLIPVVLRPPGVGTTPGQQPTRRV